MVTTAKLVAGLPEALRPHVEHWLQRLDDSESLSGMSEPDLGTLLKTVAVSEFASATIIKDPRILVECLPHFSAPPDDEHLEQFVDELTAGDDPIDALKSKLRRFRNRYLLHLLWREVAGLATLEETLSGLSMLADRLLDAAARIAARQMTERFGEIVDADGQAVSIVILAMGKLGGRELNFSSDIDLIFLYPAEGQSQGSRVLAAREYFLRLSHVIVALLDEVTADGFVFRIDTRLRPFGDSGPPVIGFAALESYLVQHGRDWERYAYIKARIAGPNPPDSVAVELFDDIIRPFVYRRYLDFGVFESLRGMHAMISAEVKRLELANNIKLGPGGIREIEFIVQSLQLVRGGNQLALQQTGLQSVLPELVDEKGLSMDTARQLRDAYSFLRRLENFIQALRDQQTHELPEHDIDRHRLCLAMGYADWPDLTEALDKHRKAVSEHFDRVAFRETDDDQSSDLAQTLGELCEAGASEDGFESLLSSNGFENAAELAVAISRFLSAPATLKTDVSSRQRLNRFLPALLIIARHCDDPVLACERTLAVLEKILRRSAYISLLNENPQAAERLVNLCEKSLYVTAEIARYPVLLDELLDPRIYNEQVTRQELADEFSNRLLRAGEVDSEQQMELLAQFQRATMFRIAVADCNGVLPVMKVSDSLTYLAEIVIEQALATAWRDLEEIHGSPRYRANGKAHAAGLGVIAYGKLGGLELSYGSDLDLVFLHDSIASEALTDGQKPVENSVFFARLVRRIVHFLTTQTRSGVLYEIDMRLRPSGKSGLLVTSTEAFERYQQENAWTWEHQALLRARPVAGSVLVARRFDEIRVATLTERVHRDKLREDVVSMRQRMRKQLDKTDEHLFDVKQGTGGVGDIEFIVQYLVLESAAREPKLFEFSDNIRQLDALADTGHLDRDTVNELQNVYRRYRQYSHRRVLNELSAMVEASEMRSDRQFVSDLWHRVFDDG